jgi:voltage-gated potassium channel
MPDETRIERRLDRMITHAQSPRSAAIVIASVTTVMTLGAGVLMTLVDEESFPSIGAGMWWAVQTVTTVGYGDHVPESPGGRLLATLVMLLGIGFITVITASITGAFVSRSREESQAARAIEPASGDDLREIAVRLDRIEAALRELGSR